MGSQDWARQLRMMLFVTMLEFAIRAMPPPSKSDMQSSMMHPETMVSSA